MRILVIGAGGFIGRQVCQALAAAGHAAVPASLRPVTGWDDPQAWALPLAGMDGAIYTAGCLRDDTGGTRDLLDLLHHRAPAALATACEAAGIGRLVHVSALCGGPSAYARSKQAGDVALAGRARIVRPSLVLGPGGASSRMLARLSRLPWLPLPAAVARCRVQPIRVEDLADGLVQLLDAPPTHAGWTAVGPQIVTVAELIAQHRAAAGRPPARVVALPDALSRLTARLGDHLPLGPWCSTALDLLARDSTAPGAPSPLRRPLRSALSGSWT